MRILVSLLSYRSILVKEDGEMDNEGVKQTFKTLMQSMLDMKQDIGENMQGIEEQIAQIKQSLGDQQNTIRTLKSKQVEGYSQDIETSEEAGINVKVEPSHTSGASSYY